MGDEKKIVHKEEAAFQREQRQASSDDADDEPDWSTATSATTDYDDDPDWKPATSAAANEQSTRTSSLKGKSPATASRAQPPKSQRMSPHNPKGEASAASAAAAGGGQSPEPRNQSTTAENEPNPPPLLPQEFQETIQEIAQGRNVSEPRLVIQKGLYKTDVYVKRHSRLSIPFDLMVSEDFLTEEEKTLLLEEKRDFRVPIMEPCLGREFERVKLSRWDVKRDGGGATSSSYVLSGVWKHVVQTNELREGDVVQLWAFRIGQELWFALVKLPDLG